MTTMMSWTRTRRPEVVAADRGDLERAWRAICAVASTWLGALVVAAAPASAQDADRTAHSPPPGWVGVEVRTRHMLSQGAGVHVGGGRVWTVAHLFSDSDTLSTVTVYTTAGLREPPSAVRAHLVASNKREDIAILQMDDSTKFSTSLPCQNVPPPYEEVEFFRVKRDRGVMTGVISARGIFVGSQAIPSFRPGIPGANLSGRRRLAFEGIAEPGMSGGGAYMTDGQCFYGVVSLVDPRPREGSPMTYVVTHALFASLNAPAGEVAGLASTRMAARPAH